MSRLAVRSAWRGWRWPARVGLVATLVVLSVALLGPTLAPYGLATPVGAPFAPPGDGSLLGTDFLGRDVLSRLLWGGRSIVLIAVAAMILAYAAGITLGLVAGLSRSGREGLLLRPVDLLLALPPFLVLAVLATGSGRGVAVLVLAGALANLPFITRYTRAATLDVSVRGYVEAAVMRGEGTLWVAAREVLPNIAGTLLADAGVRLIGAIYLVASANFLGLGLQPPAADWALMIAENRVGITIQPWSVIAPGALIAVLTVSVNLVGDEVAARLGRPTRAIVPASAAP